MPSDAAYIVAWVGVIVFIGAGYVYPPVEPLTLTAAVLALTIDIYARLRRRYHAQ